MAGPSVLMEEVRGQDNTNITTKLLTTNRTTIRKKTKVGLQLLFYNYYNHTLLPVNKDYRFGRIQRCKFSLNESCPVELLNLSVVRWVPFGMFKRSKNIRLSIC